MRVRLEASNTATGFTPPDTLSAFRVVMVPGITTDGKASSISAETNGSTTGRAGTLATVAAGSAL
ncbi:hypothetical protein GCM10007890_00970 [Methylobacterium tardum]|uniref:Uncharacterized protein n=1 Tax=Methylobacterium tardum TaxID=374432 RepID=A0AA37TE50_9HYPH|nr:hypothetical protein GCM10007890_00970 [Methylobacterium tardum]